LSFARAAASTRADQTTVRRANLAVVFQHIVRRGPSSRARIAAETGLTRGTVSSLVGELIEMRLLRDTGEDEKPGRVGRPAVALELDDAVVGIGLEINVDYLAVSVEDISGSVRYERRVSVDNRGSSSAPVLARLARMARRAIDEMEERGLVPAGVAVAVPGLAEVGTGRLLNAPNLGWSNVPIAAELGERLGTPVTIENEANLAAVAEHWCGAAVGIRSFISIFGEIGVGAGIFIDGELFRGAHGFGGELGHMTIDALGPPCACGSRGCLETFVGEEAIARRAGVARRTTGRSRPITEELLKLAREGDPRVLTALRETGQTLGIALASASNLFDVDAVVLGGCFGPLSPWLADDVRAGLDEHMLSASWSTCELRASQLGERGSVRGAAIQTLKAIVASPWLVTDRVAATQGAKR
jgi:predicted NBD/HSP70 family sugar kinase